MRQKRLIAVSCLLAGMALGGVGCDPFETDITLNSDGSGKMVQKARLSAGPSLAMRQYAGYRLKGFRPILTEEAAKAWSSANPQSGVKVTSYSSKVGDDGSVRVECAVEFADVKQFAESVWGWPLQLSGTETMEGYQLQFDDPARYLLLLLACSQAQNLSPPPKIGEPGGLEYMAFRDVISGMTPGLRIRTVIHLPAAAQRAEGAALSADRRTLTCERTIGEGKTPWAEWLAGKPAVLVLAPGDVKFKPFAAPLSLIPDQPVVITQPLEVGKEQGYRLQISNINSSVRFDADGHPSGDRQVNISLNVYLPDNAKIVNPNSRGQMGQPAHMLSAAKDDQGNDLRTAEAALNLNIYQYDRGMRRGGAQPGQPVGNAGISLRTAPNETKVLSLLEGYFALTQIVEEEKLEVKPLRDYLDKPIEQPNYTLRFTAIKGNRVEFTVTRKTDMGDWWNEFNSLPWFSGNGQPLQGNNLSQLRSDGNTMTFQANFPGPFPDDGYVVFTYPTKLREIRMPFSFKDVKLP